MTAGDVNSSPLKHERLKFVSTDVTSWPSLSAFFKHAIQHRAVIDHVFGNAGIAGRTNYVEEQLDSNGELLEPTHEVYDVNLKGMLNTCALGLHYMRKSPTDNSSIVVSASCSSFQRFRSVDYTTTKHAVLGFMRGMVPTLKAAGTSVRINAVAPSWTATGLIPKPFLEKSGVAWQGPEAVARSVALLMADATRNGQLIYSVEGRYKEIEEGVLLKALSDILGDEQNHDDALVQVAKTAMEMSKAGDGGRQESKP